MRRSLILIVAFFVLNGPVRAAEVPELLREHSFNAATLARAVNYYVALGEDAAIRELAFRESERVGWLCRILFAPKGRSPLRPPLYGALSLPYDSMPLKRWPLFPVAHSGGTYFVLSEGYSLEGHAESPEQYLAYCRENGVFRKTPVPVPTREQALKDAAALRRSRAWRTIRWPSSSPQESRKSTDTFIWAFVQAQAEATPATQLSTVLSH